MSQMSFQLEEKPEGACEHSSYVPSGAPRPNSIALFLGVYMAVVQRLITRLLFAAHPLLAVLCCKRL